MIHKMQLYTTSMVLTMQTIIAERHAMAMNRPYKNITFRQENIRFWSARSLRSLSRINTVYT